jgi:ABC-type multidrug transport system ATPase subunit
LTPAIHTDALTKRYGETLALDGLDLTVNAGEVYGYLGPNGSGKTTTIRLLLGLHRPSAGRAELFGLDAWHEPVRAHRRVAYVAGEPLLWPSLTGAETFEFLDRLRQLTGSVLGAPKWLLELTPFAHVGLVPAQAFRAADALVMLAIAASTTLAAIWAFQRRDVIGP